LGGVGFDGLADEIFEVKHATAATATGVGMILEFVYRRDRLRGENLAEFRFRDLEAVAYEIAHEGRLVLECEVLLVDATVGADPVVGQVIEGGAFVNTGGWVAKLGVIDVAADVTNVQCGRIVAHISRILKYFNKPVAGAIDRRYLGKSISLAQHGPEDKLQPKIGACSSCQFS
jgi:hypothetical protein